MMLHMLSLFIILVALFTSPLRAQVPHISRSIFQPGEVLQYSVKWKFFRLGTITVRTKPYPGDSTGNCVRVCMLVESNPSLPFISLWEYNEAIIDLVNMTSLRYTALHYFGEKADSVSHEFLRDERTVKTEIYDIETGTIVRRSRVPDVDWYMEGTSLFFYTRHAALKREKCIVPTVVKGQMMTTSLEYAAETEEFEIDAWEEPIRVRRYAGVADWEGATSAGLTGDFTGWLSDDSAAIPVKAELKIFLGSIDIELERWSRAGWRPSAGLHASREEE